MNNLYKKYPIKSFDKRFNRNFSITFLDKITLWLNSLCFLFICILFILLFIKSPFNNSMFWNMIFIFSICPIIMDILVTLKYRQSFKYCLNNQNKFFLCLSNFISFLGFLFVDIAHLLDNNPIILFISLLFIALSISLIYYIKYPIYLNNKLSLKNLLCAIDNRINLIRIFYYLVISLFIILIVASFLLFSVSNFGQERSFESYQKYPKFNFIISKRTVYISSHHKKSTLLRKFHPLNKFNKIPGHKIKMKSYNELLRLDQEHYFIKLNKSYPKFSWIKNKDIMYIYSKYTLNTLVHKNRYLKRYISNARFSDNKLKKLNKSEFHKKDEVLSNKKYLINFRPKFNSVCYGTVFCTFIIFIMMLSMILGLSLFYCWKNNIHLFTEIGFISKLSLIILEFVSITIPVIYFISNNVIRYLINHPSYISMNYAVGILFFLPFIEILYVLFTINSLIKVHC